MSHNKYRFYVLLLGIIVSLILFIITNISLLKHFELSTYISWINQYKSQSSQPSCQHESQVIQHPQIFSRRGDYWVDANKIRANKQFYGNESITLTTPADHTNLDNLITLAEKWKGPISCCVYATGTDYKSAIQIIKYLRECTSPSIKDLVTFHFLYHRKYVPLDLQSVSWERFQSFPMNCSKKPGFGNRVKTFRKTYNLLFPINTARNVARQMATTYFVFPSDIELYPSDGVIGNFLKMVGNRSDRSIQSSRPKVFVLPVFELKANVTSLPVNKDELKLLLKKNLALKFHKEICAKCHVIPNYTYWLSNTMESEIFTVVKREWNYVFWEPFYIGTKNEPEFDERFTWEGRYNKRIQVYTMCVLRYEFHVLNHAFVVHRPGIKRARKKFTDSALVNNTIDKMLHAYVPEITALYGYRSLCRV